MRLMNVEGGFVGRPVKRAGARGCVHYVGTGACAACFARATLALKQLSDLGQSIATDALTALKVKP